MCSGVPWWHSRFRIQCCYCSDSGRCCGMDLLPGWELLHTKGPAKKIKIKKKAECALGNIICIKLLILRV